MVLTTVQKIHWLLAYRYGQWSTIIWIQRTDRFAMRLIQPTTVQLFLTILSILLLYPLRQSFPFKERKKQCCLLIPELVLLVSALLASSDVARCILVCKDWSRQFETHLWTNFWPTMGFTNSLRFSPQMKAAMNKNLRHIRTFRPMDIDETLLQVLVHGLPQHHDDIVENTDTFCTNLQQIDLQHFIGEHYYPVSWHSHIVTLLCHNQYLTYVAAPLEFLGSDVSAPIISTLRHLQHLALFSLDNRGTSQQISLIFQACLPLPELTELHIFEMDVIWLYGTKTTDTPDLDAIIKEAAIARSYQTPRAKRIKSLRLPSNRGGYENPLPLLLLKSDLLDLDTCEIPGFSADEDVRDIELVVREHCPNLKHLICPCFRWERQDGQAARAFIRGCSGIQTFTSHLFSDYDAENWDTFDDDDDEFEPRRIISQLVSRHSSTLEVFELTESFQVFSHVQQEILSRCTKLKRFWVMCNDSETSMGAIMSRHISTGDWVCMELTELGLALNLRPKDADSYFGMDGEEIADWSEDDHDAYIAYQLSTIIATNRVYTQIGRLEELEELTLQVDRSNATWQSSSDYAHNLTLFNGWLGEMAGLKNLRRLRLKADFWSAMGQAEVEFMHEHWPLLHEISFCCNLHSAALAMASHQTTRAALCT